MHKVFFGEQWRSLWTNTLNLPVIQDDNLTYKSGYNSYDISGTAAYKFVPVDSQYGKIIIEEISEYISPSVKEDLPASINPFAEQISDLFFTEVDIENENSKLIIYRTPQGDKPGLIKETLNNSITTDSFFNDNTFRKGVGINRTDYLKIRLIDILLGNWDRSGKNIRWRLSDEDGRRSAKPIPVNNYHAFSKLDGLIPWASTIAVKSLESFNNYYPKIEDLTWNAKYLDRIILSGIDKNEWDSITTSVIKVLSSSFLSNAVDVIPPSFFKEREALLSDLILRRDYLQDAADNFYSLIFKTVEIYGSDTHDDIEINIDDHRISVKAVSEGKIIFNRTYDEDETSEIRINSLNGSDSISISGNNDITLIILSGKGRDVIVNKNGAGNFEFYDEDNDIELLPADTEADRIYPAKGDSAFRSGKIYSEEYFKDYGHDWRLQPLLEINTEVGLLIGGGPILYSFGFGSYPYKYRMELTVSYANKEERFRINYLGDFYSVFKKVDLRINALVSGLEVINFFGFGNESSKEKKLEEGEFYRVKQKHYIIKPQIFFNINENSNIFLSAESKLVRTDFEENTFLAAALPYGNETKFYFGLGGGILIDNRDNRQFPKSGIRLSAEGLYFPKIDLMISDFTKTNLEFSSFLNLDFINSIGALRIKLEKVFGNYPFFDAATAGGDHSLRGFERERFTGDGSIVLNNEIRTSLFDLNLIIPSEVGSLIYFDTGRVFYKKEISKKYHSSVGIGFWSSFLNEEILVAGSMAKSTEGLFFYLDTHLTF